MKIGSYSIPDLRLFPNIYKDISLIYENYVLEDMDNADTVAKLVGHTSANSGAWKSKVADMRLYGLLESRGLKVTHLAERLTHGTREQKDVATKEAILNVPLWKEFYDQFGKQVPDSNFWVQLQKITGISNIEAQKHADSVRKAYLDDISNIKAEKEAKDMTGQEDAGKIDKFTSISDRQASIVANLMKEGAYDIAKSFIDFVKQKIGKEETSQEEG